jgi:hypothetical protein
LADVELPECVLWPWRMRLVRYVHVLPELTGGGLLGDDVRVGLAHVDFPKGDLSMSASSLTTSLTTPFVGSTVYLTARLSTTGRWSPRRATNSPRRHTTTVTASRLSASALTAGTASHDVPERLLGPRHMRDDRGARRGRVRQHLRALGRGHHNGLQVQPGLLISHPTPQHITILI